AGDDAAGLGISEKMRSQIRGMEQAERNVQDGISLIQTAEGSLEESTNIAQRMRELAVQAGNETLEKEDRDHIQKELSQLGQELVDISKESLFNGVKLLSSDATDIKIQAGANKEVRTLNMVKTEDEAEKIKALSVQTHDEAQKAIEDIDSFISFVNEGRATLGAQQNRLEYVQGNLTNTGENLTSAESRIRDVDVAKEMMELAKNNIIGQASQAMAQQAKQQPQSITQLLQ
ncbi:MAG: flagellin, partial [Peptostreptococcaceae bacterium]